MHKIDFYMEKRLEINFQHYASIEEMPAEDRVLVEEAQMALKQAHAPYSNFHVGAAARLSNGTVLHAANFESEVYPAGLCAERSLLFYVQTNFPNERVESLAIASEPSLRECYPCGQCRQVLVDVERRQGSPLRVIMTGAGSASVVEHAADLLPFTFTL